MEITVKFYRPVAGKRIALYLRGMNYNFFASANKLVDIGRKADAVHTERSLRDDWADGSERRAWPGAQEDIMR